MNCISHGKKKDIKNNVREDVIVPNMNGINSPKLSQFCNKNNNQFLVIYGQKVGIVNGKYGKNQRLLQLSEVMQFGVKFQFNPITTRNNLISI